MCLSEKKTLLERKCDKGPRQVNHSSVKLFKEGRAESLLEDLLRKCEVSIEK